MSDWLEATEQVFINMTRDPEVPNPPKTLCLFWKGKMVALLNAEAFGAWCEKLFVVYKQRDQIDDDQAKWQKIAGTLENLKGDELSQAITEAWRNTIFAEFSLYGAETNLSKQLARFDAPTCQKIWGAFTVPDKPTFLARIDAELAESKDPAALAKKYPWIQDGYDGLSLDAQQYFEKRLKIVSNVAHNKQNYEEIRAGLIQKLALSGAEVKALGLARKLAEFMDDRKAWMMQTRRLLTQSVGKIEYGWFFNGAEASTIGVDDTRELWERYVDFKVSTSAVVGIVASNGGRHFINGEAAIVTNPTDIVKDGRIVVVPSTSPSYVPLMRKAKALVTDHGGMMSHAAIVARQFNLPCIVGTKQATKILQNGDKVVLDLVRGEVNR